MSAPPLDRDAISTLAQACFSRNPVIILGSGASIPHGLPTMRELQKCLEDNIVTDGSAEEDDWILVKTALASGDHLEQALQGKFLPQSLVQKIVRQTWLCVNNSDKTAFINILKGEGLFPVGQLLRNLFRSTNNEINIVTTNYDRMAEYACSSHDILYSTGFAPGYIQKHENFPQLSFYRGNRRERLVRIWKVHGSLDWFKRTNEEYYAAPVFELPAIDAQPLIVTPGFDKYEQVSQEPFRSTITGADSALQNANAFLSIGFGFRDKHIEPKILARCRQTSVPVVVIGKELTSEAKHFLRNHAGSKYIGLEKKDAKTRVYTHTFPDGQDIDDPDLWSLNGFLGLVT